MKYVLDPMLFALDKTMSKRDFLLYVNRLILWEKWMEKNPEDVYVLSDTSIILGYKNCFPIYDTFDDLVKQHKVDYVQASTLNKAISNIITKAKKIDKCDGQKADINYDLQAFTLQRNNNVFANADSQKMFERILWYVYCHCNQKSIDPETFIVFGSNLVDDVSIDVEYTTLIEKEGEIEEVTKTDNAKVLCKSSLAEFFRCNTAPRSILTKEDDKNAIALAARIAVYQKAGLQRVMESFDKVEIRIQDTFIDDYQNNHYKAQPSFLNSFVESISDTILNMNIRDREDFRTGIGGNNPQKTHRTPEGTWLAWRWKVTESVSYQYWQLNGFQKFANIGEHDYYVCKWED